MKEKRSFSAFGVSSLLVIFSVLCLTVFTLLTLSSVSESSKFSKNTAEAVYNYYSAECAAHETLGALRRGEVLSGVTQDGDVYTYSHRISDTLVLSVAVRLKADGGYTVLRWQCVTDTQWSVGNIDVWDGN